MSGKYTAIIVEDEKPARDRLRKMLKEHPEIIEIIGEATDGEEGLALARSRKPEVIFLDIQMPLMDGFEMLQQLSYRPRIIFTTAFDQYAIKAFEENSIDYLLKPIEEERLRRSLKKLETLQYTGQPPELYEFLRRLNRENPKTIPVSLGDRMILVKVEDIVYFHAEDKYVVLYDKDDKKHLLSTPLKELEELLHSSFIRIHRAYIINCDYIREIRKLANGKLTFIMKGASDTAITSSHSYTPAVRKRFQL